MIAQRSLIVIGIEPAWKSPPGHRAARLRQNEFCIGPREYSRSTSLQAIAQVQPVGRNIQRVARVIAPAEMTVVTRPIELPVSPYLIHLADLLDLEPAPQDVLSRRIPDKLPAPLSPFNLPEKAEEKEHVSDSYTLIFQVSLCSTDLSKEAPPPTVTGKGVRSDIGVHVREAPSITPPIREVLDDLSEIDTDMGQVAVMDGLFIVVAGNRQRIHCAIGKDGAGASPGFAVKPFPAENQFSWLHVPSPVQPQDVPVYQGYPEQPNIERGYQYILPFY